MTEKAEKRKQTRRKSTGRRFADVPGRRRTRRRKADQEGPYRRPCRGPS